MATSHNFTTKQTLWTYTEKVLFPRKYAKLKINIVWKKYFSFLPKSTSKHCLCVSWFLFHLDKLSIFNISLKIFLVMNLKSNYNICLYWYIFVMIKLVFLIKLQLGVSFEDSIALLMS